MKKTRPFVASAIRWANWTSSWLWLQLGSRKMLMVMPLAEQRKRLAHRRLFGSSVRRVEQEELLALEVRRRQAVGDQDDLAVGRVLRLEELTGELQTVLDVGEVRREVDLRDPLVAHVRSQPHDGVVHRHRLGHEGRQLRDVPRLGERVHLDELEEVAGVLAADQTVQGQAHPLGVDVLPVVAHRAAHVDHDGRCALGRVARRGGSRCPRTSGGRRSRFPIRRRGGSSR